MRNLLMLAVYFIALFLRVYRRFWASLPGTVEPLETFRSTATDISFILDEIYGPAVSLWQRERPGPTLAIYQVTEAT